MADLSYQLRRISGGVLLAACFVGLCASASPADEVKGPLSPEESLKHIQIPDGLVIEIAAAEPEVIDPVAVRFDEDDRMWVVEMSDYPNGPKEDEKPKSRIKVLRDKDLDGRYETATVFADGLLFATGVQPWQGGVIVTMAGEVAWMKDTDGDDVADVREVWFTGFAEDNPQLRANHPTFGPDNRIYIANGLRGGKVIAVKPEWAKDARPLDISGKDFRFDPLTGKYEAVTGNGQFGLTFDGEGNRYVCSNRNPAVQILIEDRYLHRNPHLAATRVVHDVLPAGNDSRVFPLTRAWTTSNLHAGQFTAACGVLAIHKFHKLSRQYNGNIFTCDPTGNLVHRAIVNRSRTRFTSKPHSPTHEFLASHDEWFRPVNLQLGPDGAIYVVDMYRAVVEHPQWVPEELKNRPDLRLGDDRGRIYRIADSKSLSRFRSEEKENRERERPFRIPRSVSGFPKPGHRQTNTLAVYSRLLTDWHLETVRRLVYELQDDRVTRAHKRITNLQNDQFTRRLRSSLETNASSSYLQYLYMHQISMLHGMGRLSADDLLILPKTAPARALTIRLAEPFLDEHNGLPEAILKLATTNDERVQFQLALSLGETNQTEEVTHALVTIVSHNLDSEPHRIAALSAAHERPADLLRELFFVARHEDQDEDRDRLWITILEETAALTASRRLRQELNHVGVMLGGFEADGQQDPEAHLAEDLRGTLFHLAIIRGLITGLSRRGASFVDLMKQLDAGGKFAVNTIGNLAYLIAESDRFPRIARLDAYEFLRMTGADGDSLDDRLKVLDNESDASLRLAVIRSLQRSRAKGLGDELLRRFPSEAPALQRAMLDVIIARPDNASKLLDAIEEGTVARTLIDASRRQRLRRFKQEPLRGRVASLLSDEPPDDRRVVLDRYKDVLNMKSDPKRGQAIFAKHCAVCHRIGKTGVNVAPDISDSRTKTPRQLLDSILDPNRAIDANYFSYSVITNRGQVHSGIVAAETANAVTLRQQENKTITILRQDIEEMKNSGKSLMPVGLEQKIPPQDMADLISYIKNWRYLDGKTPLGKPDGK